MIELQNISKSFDGVSVLDNISAEIPDSGIFCNMRRIGKRKDDADAHNSRARTAGFRQYFRARGQKQPLFFQNDRLLPWLSALDNVAAVCSKERAKEMLEKFELSDALSKKPAELSGGMCRRGGVGACAGVRRGYSPARRAV